MPLKKFGVVGFPIAHSLSPHIHQSFAKECHIDLCYEKYEVSPEADIFEVFVRNFFRQGGAGLNITVPFKERAFHLVDERTERAERAGVVNTLIPLSSHKLQGDNTDGIGFIRDLKENYRQEMNHKRVLILGSGGVTKGILPLLLAESPKSITIATRYASVDKRQQAMGQCCYSAYENLLYPFDMVLNATPLSLYNELPLITSKILHRNTFCYDFAYDASRETTFTRWAKKHGMQTSDGLGMLMYQAAEAFYRWHQVYPKIGNTISSFYSLSHYEKSK